MGRSSYRRGPSRAEVVGAGFAVLGVLLLVLGVSFGLDMLAAQFVLFVFGSFHIIAGFWQAVWLVITTEFVVGLSAYGGSKASK